MPRIKLYGPWRLGHWTLKGISIWASNHRSRARRGGLPATLTSEEWLLSVDHFAGLCAYCQKHFSEVLEHAIPFYLGGGTTAGNCLPACSPCDKKKGSNIYKKAFPGRAEYLEDYLAIRTTGPNVGKPPGRLLEFKTELAKEVRAMANIQAMYLEGHPIMTEPQLFDFGDLFSPEERSKAFYEYFKARESARITTADRLDDEWMADLEADIDAWQSSFEPSDNGE